MDRFSHHQKLHWISGAQNGISMSIEVQRRIERDQRHDSRVILVSAQMTLYIPSLTYHIGPSGTLTTEYKPLERESSVKRTPAAPPSATSTTTTNPPVPLPTPEIKPPMESDEPAVDPSTLPVVRAPSSAPKIDLDKDGLLDGRSIYEVDIASLETKAWRRPGSDLSDWFNYGFDEISWEAYAARRRDLGEMAPILKANVLVCVSCSLCGY
jgi:pre-mRNA 3'-end-processing factor FIP1